MLGIESIDASGHICVSANPTGIGPPIPVTALTGINGGIHASGISIFGNCLAFPAPIGNVLITRSSDIKLKAAPMLWIRSFPDSPPTPTDVTVGDPAGLVGISVNASIISILNATTLNVISPNSFWQGIKNLIGAETIAGVKAQTGAEARSGPKCTNGVQNINGSLKVEGLVTAPAFLGNISACSGKKNFDIKHPSKEGHRLRYVSLEGPTADVFLRGKLENNSIIKLPEYWKNLVDPDTISINLTPIGLYQELFVEKIEWGKNIIVKNNLSGPINCHYVIYGERSDVEKNIPEYSGLTPEDYPGDNSQCNINGF